MSKKPRAAADDPAKGGASIDAVQIAAKQRHLYLLQRVKNNQPLSRKELEELAKHEGKSPPKAADGTKRRSSKTIAAEIRTDNILFSQREAARHAKVNTRTVRRWEEAGMPTGIIEGKKCYFKDQIDIFKNQGGKPSEAKNRQQEAEANVKELKAKLLEIELKIKQGELIERDKIETHNVRKVAAVKRALLGLGRKIAPALAKEKKPKKVRQIIDTEIRGIIEGFANIKKADE